MPTPVLILWHVTLVGCVVIWSVTVPRPATSRWEVAQAALPVEYSSNPGKKAHSVAEEEVGKSGSLASMLCMMMRVTPTPLMKQDNCMCHCTLDKLLPSQCSARIDSTDVYQTIFRTHTLAHNSETQPPQRKVYNQRAQQKQGARFTRVHIYNQM